MYESNPYFYGTGRRKESVARVRVYAGTGKVTINDRDIDDYFGLDTLKLIVNQPLVLTETKEKFGRCLPCKRRRCFRSGRRNPATASQGLFFSMMSLFARSLKKPAFLHVILV